MEVSRVFEIYRDNFDTLVNMGMKCVEKCAQTCRDSNEVGRIASEAIFSRQSDLNTISSRKRGRPPKSTEKHNNNDNVPQKRMPRLNLDPPATYDPLPAPAFSQLLSQSIRDSMMAGSSDGGENSHTNNDLWQTTANNSAPSSAYQNYHREPEQYDSQGTETFGGSSQYYGNHLSTHEFQPPSAQRHPTVQETRPPAIQPAPVVPAPVAGSSHNERQKHQKKNSHRLGEPQSQIDGDLEDEIDVEKLKEDLDALLTDNGNY